MLHDDWVDRDAPQRPIDRLWNDIVPIDLTGIDVGIESLTHIRGQTGKHIGRAGPAMVHVNQGKLNMVALPSMCDLTETRKSR